MQFSNSYMGMTGQTLTTASGNNNNIELTSTILVVDTAHDGDAITGMIPPVSDIPGLIYIVNINATNNLILPNNSSGSTTGFRFYLTGLTQLSLAPGETCQCAFVPGLGWAPILQPGTILSQPPSGFLRDRNIFYQDFTANLGTVITLAGLTVTQPLTGLLTTDCVQVSCLSGLPGGVAIGNARVSAADTLSIRFTTAVLGNVALGSLTYRCTVFRP